MTTLITGGGLIGILTAQLLAARGDRVVVADVRGMTTGPGIESVACDVTDHAAVDDLIAGHRIERVVHTAAMLSTGIRQDPVRGIEVNVVGTANVLDAARRHGVKRIVCASSTTVGYAAFPAAETGPIPEDFPMRLLSHRPASIYAMTKIANEQTALLYNDLYGLDVVILRYGAVLGGREEAPTSVPGRLLARLMAAGRSGAVISLDDPFLIWGGREEFVDARDCARANVHSLDAEAPYQRVYNVAPGSWCSLAEFVHAVKRVHPGLSVVLPEASARGFAGFPHQRPAPSDVSAAVRELGFKCVHDLDDTIRFWTTPTSEGEVRR